MRVLVTGHNGYIGTVLVPMLLERGHQVAGLDTNYFASCLFTGSLPEVPQLQKDIRDLAADDVRGFDAVIHLAGLSNDPLGDYKPNLTEEINEQAAVHLARLAKAAGARRFLFASSCSNYGAGGLDFLDEQATFNPVTPYGISKVRVEAALTELAGRGLLPHLSAGLHRLRSLAPGPLRPGGQQPDRLGLHRGPGLSEERRHPLAPVVHVADIALAYIAALEAPRELVHDQAFNVGTTNENYQIRELAEIVRDVVPNCRIEFAPDAGPDTRCYRVDCNKIALTLHGFKPQWTARRGVEELYEAYQAVGLSLNDFEGERYKRIAHVKRLVTDGALDGDLRWTGLHA